MQLAGELAKDTTQRMNSLQTGYTVLKQEGVSGLYKGCVPAGGEAHVPAPPPPLLCGAPRCCRLSAGLLRQVTYTTTRLGIYNTLLNMSAPKDGTPTPFLMKASIGIVAGACGALVGTPGMGVCCHAGVGRGGVRHRPVVGPQVTSPSFA